MKIEGVQVRVSKTPFGAEVFLQCDDPVVNTVFHLPADASIEPGTYNLTLSKASDTEKKKEK